MKKILFIFMAALLPATLLADIDFRLYGYVKAAGTNIDLTQAKILLFDNDGNVKDTIRANQGFRWRDNQVDTISMYSFKVPRVDSTYVFDVVCPGYQQRTMSYTVEKVGKREVSREIPIIYLSRELMLKEVTVKASKVKFYNKGDTVVYDASAFMLPEGSMLDALISQLPGVELSTDGQIKVNGEYVESLLLDGNKFFDGNNNLMLENISAYTVKNVQVYEGVSKQDEVEGNTNKKVLTMDVRLKKEYSIGWIINAQGGYGTENRYLGRLFAAWFNPRWRISLVGNMNNLNDNRQPGRSDTWTPEQMPSGRQRNSILALQYNYDNPENHNMAQGEISWLRSNSDLETRTDRTNFLSGGNTYEKSFSNSYNKSTALYTSHLMNFNKGIANYGVNLSGTYSDTRSSSSALSAAFNQDQDTISRETLDAIYSAGKQELLETVINRAKTRSDGWTKAYRVGISPFAGVKISKSDRLTGRLNVYYYSAKNELWKDYEITYGQDYTNTEKLRQYFDNTPNHDLTIGGSLTYNAILSPVVGLSFYYNYSFEDIVKDSYMYALDRLADMGIYGTLPSGYIAALDPNNSYKSHLIQNSHTFYPNLSFDKKFEKSHLQINLEPRIEVLHRNFNYWRNEQDYKISRTDFTFDLQTFWDCRFFYWFRRRGGDGPEGKWTNTLMYSFIVNSRLPDMFDLVDVVNDSDPLNIYLGNPGLKQQKYHRHHFRWNWMPKSYVIDNIFLFNYSYTLDALTRGYTYDTSTGVRYNKMYNVGGNHSYMFTNELKWQFGSSKQFTLNSYSEVELSQVSDMIGIDLEEPQLSKVHNRRITQNTRLSWTVGRVNLGLRCDLSNRYTTSDQLGFSTLNATHVNSGLTVQANLPAGFSINTDFMCYTRNGYGVEQLDTTDPVWNIRLSYCPPRNTKWLFMVDGYDMLHTLNNVSYTVNAAGRVVSYTNVLPRYFLFSVQYRLSLQPKKR